MSKGQSRFAEGLVLCMAIPMMFAGVASAQELGDVSENAAIEDNRLIYNGDDERIVVEAWGEDGLRVRPRYSTELNPYNAI